MKSLKDVFIKYKFLYESFNRSVSKASNDEILQNADIVPESEIFAKAILSNWHKGDNDYEDNNDNEVITVRSCFDDQGLFYRYTTPQVQQWVREQNYWDGPDAIRKIIPMDGFVEGDDVSVSFWYGFEFCVGELPIKEMSDADKKHLWKVLKRNIKNKNEKR